MAATMPTPNMDTLVTIKINIEGSNRKFKLPLRELSANILPDKLRRLLSIPQNAETIFERYSDSAAAFIVLDPNNTAVYKQLNRAAKAKLKLRLRVTVIEKEPTVPKPATVEDEEPAPVSPISANAAPSVSQTFNESSTTINDTPASDASEKIVSPGSVAEIQRGFEELLIGGRTSRSQKPQAPPTCCTQSTRDLPSIYRHQEAFRMNNCSSTEIPVTRGQTARDRWFAELATVSAERQSLRAAAAPYMNAPASHTAVFSVYCNNCTDAIPDVHYHCGICDQGDFDLCQSCVDKGVICENDEHWMIKRIVQEGRVINSTTERIAQKPKEIPVSTIIPTTLQAEDSGLMMTTTRTCNSCIQEYTEENFITCTTCPDYDLCIPCHKAGDHGHHPKHAFAPAVENTQLGGLAKALLAPGRNVGHNAICDGCDKYIHGVRHKCLDCPDWDYCGTCIVNADFIHPRHRFVPIYEPLSDLTYYRSEFSKVRHHGIYCDGPICASHNGDQTYIMGDRYKCAVCDDKDFCASCEASPANDHNRTHPLIKFKTPVRHVNVTTLGDHADGEPMPIMGDRRESRTMSKSTETTPASSTNAATQVQTVADLKPMEPIKTEVTEVEAEKVVEKVEAPKELPAAAVTEELVAHFVRDAVADGTVLPPSTVFEQTWFLRNGGKTAWPAGCSVKFVSGDNMCSVDPEHPASVHELISAAESTICYTEVAPGQEIGFNVLLRTPKRPGTCISYWRLTGPDGNKFGHRLWCDITVKEPEVIEEPKAVVAEPEVERSQMIFPKLEKESPATSIHEETEAAVVEAPEAAVEELDEFDDFAEDVLEDDETEDGFMTDEEYDILDASDEEYLAEQGKASKK